MGELGLIADGSVLIDGERIDEVGSTRRIENLSKARRARILDVSGKVVAPGFVDSQTRLLSLPSIMSIARHLDPFGRDEQLSARSASSKTTLKSMRLATQAWARRLAANGVTTADIHIGADGTEGDYRRGLRAVESIDGGPIQTSATLTVNLSKIQADPVAAVREAIRMAGRRGRRNRVTVALEVEVNSWAWSDELCRKVAELCREAGLRIKAIDCSTNGVRAARAAVSFQASSFEGFDADWDDRLQADVLGESCVVCTLIPEDPAPGRSFHAPIGRTLIDRGAAVCLASGFGARNRSSINMALAMGRACRQMGMTPAEAFTAATLNGAAAMGIAESVGSLEPGKFADLNVFDVSDYREVPYFLGINLCLATIKAGRLVSRAGGVERAGEKSSR